MTAVAPHQKLDLLRFTTAPVVLAANAATAEQLQRILDADPVFDVYAYIREEFGKYAACFLTEEQAAQVIEWLDQAENEAFDFADWQVNQ